MSNKLQSFHLASSALIRFFLYCNICPSKLVLSVQLARLHSLLNENTWEVRRRDCSSSPASSLLPHLLGLHGVPGAPYMHDHGPDSPEAASDREMRKTAAHEADTAQPATCGVGGTVKRPCAAFPGEAGNSPAPSILGLCFSFCLS